MSSLSGIQCLGGALIIFCDASVFTGARRRGEPDFGELAFGELAFGELAFEGSRWADAGWLHDDADARAATLR